jgi:hypothetical protein
MLARRTIVGAKLWVCSRGAMQMSLVPFGLRLASSIPGIFRGAELGSASAQHFPVGAQWLQGSRLEHFGVPPGPRGHVGPAVLTAVDGGSTSRCVVASQTRSYAFPPSAPMDLPAPAICIVLLVGQPATANDSRSLVVSSPTSTTRRTAPSPHIRRFHVVAVGRRILGRVRGRSSANTVEEIGGRDAECLGNVEEALVQDSSAAVLHIHQHVARHP